VSKMQKVSRSREHDVHKKLKYIEVEKGIVNRRSLNFSKGKKGKKLCSEWIENGLRKEATRDFKKEKFYVSRKGRMDRFASGSCRAVWGKGVRFRAISK